MVEAFPWTGGLRWDRGLELEAGVQGSGFMGLGFRVFDLRFRVQSVGLLFGFWVQGFKFQGLGFRV